MSNYIQVLKRLQKEKGETLPSAPASIERSVSPAAPAPVERSASPAVPAPVERSVSAAAPAAVEPASPPASAPPIVPRPATMPERVRPAAKRPTVAPPPVPPVEAKERPQPAAPAPKLLPAKRPETVTVPEGIAALFDRIRTLDGARAPRTLVFAGAANAESVGRMTEALAIHAERHGLRVTLADLTQSSDGTALVCRPDRTSTTLAPSENVLSVDLSGAAPEPSLESWIRRVAPDTDLVIVTGPPLVDSIDAALFARACDGLVIVADTEVTARGALQTAAERARIAGCHTLGVVMHGTEDRTPAWMRRLFATDRRPPTT